MKMLGKYIYRALLAAAGLLAAMALASCERIDEEPFPELEEGEALLDLKFSVAGTPKVEVRAYEDNDEYERAVYSLRIYIFSAQTGNLVGFRSIANPALTPSTAETYDYTSTIEDIRTLTGSVYIYAIANATTQRYVTDPGQYNILDDGLETNPASANFNRAQFLTLTYDRTAGGVNPLDNTFLMTGYVNDENPVTIGRVAGTTNAMITSPTDTDAQLLKLYKVISKNTFNVVSGENVTFTPEYYSIVNVPLTNSLHPNEDLNPTSADEYESIERIVLTSSQFSFYLPENLQSTLPNGAGSITQWTDREEKRNGEFYNAPALATYIRINGRYEGPFTENGVTTQVSGIVDYFVHLGNFDPANIDTNPPGSVDNFHVRRGRSYLYTITINGVSDIIAEARLSEDQTDPEPGEEGVIISPSGALFELDSHYEARSMSFSLAEAQAQLAERGFTYIVKVETHFGETASLVVNGEGNVYEATEYKNAFTAGTTAQLQAVATVGTDGMLDVTDYGTTLGVLTGVDGTIIGEGDYYWLNFVKNTEDLLVTTAHDITDVCRYPGDGATATEPGGGNTQIITIFELLRDIHAATVDSDYTFFDQQDGNNDYLAYFTCFVDENYYPNKAWSEFANITDNRMAYIANQIEESYDKFSTYIDAKYVISQPHIWTIYDLDYAVDEAFTAFGMESVSEEPEAGFAFDNNDYDISLTNTDYNSTGRTAALAYSGDRQVASLEEPTWWGRTQTTNPSNYQQYNGHQDIYTVVSKACLSRNRDENGSGEIEDDELKWYLATTDNLRALWAGTEILPLSARLFDPNNFTDASWAPNTATNVNTALADDHYFCFNTTQQIFWPEEGASTSSTTSGDWSVAARLRCVRTLQSNTEGLDDPDTYYSTSTVTVDGVDYTEIEVIIDDSALRSYTGTALASSLERDEQNRLYKKFRVAAANLTDADGNVVSVAPVNYEQVSWGVTGAEDLCATNANYGAPWRVPNQRELMVMASAIGAGTLLPDGGQLWSSTFYTGAQGFLTGLVGNDMYKYETATSGNTTYPQNCGFFLLSSGPITITPPGSAYIRCVRDVQ